MRKALFVITTLVLFAVLNYSIYQKEIIKSTGETVLLELVPVDPRSLIQGDYMRLRYAIENGPHTDSNTKRGYMVVGLDSNRVAHFVRFDSGGELAPGEKLLRYHNRYGTVNIVPDSFMFQEGLAERFRRAKYGSFKFDSAGNYVLVGLVDGDFQLIE